MTSDSWGQDTQCVVTLTFDVDGPSGTLRRQPELANHPSVISMGEFGPRVGVRRILDLLDGYDVPATFFVPGWVAERHEDTVREISHRGHEVAHHGYLHEPPSSLGPEEDEGAILDRGSTILEGITGSKPLGYRSPSWELSEHSLALLHARGFVYDSSLMGDEKPYTVEAGPNGRLVELPVHWSLDDAPFFTYVPVLGRSAPIVTPPDVFEAWRWAFDDAYRLGALFMLTMHPHTTGRLGRVAMLDRLIRYMCSKPQVRFMRCIDLAQHWTESRLT